MEYLSRIPQMRQFSAKACQDGTRLGLVPTMGALHEGHLSLVRRARKECDLVVVSIFVNSAQFGPQEDFRKYPRNVDQDLKILRDLRVTAVYVPDADDMYPLGFNTWIEPGAIATQFEGASRPNHFRGIDTVILKLFNQVRPQVAYFGRKDFQQQVIIRRMVRDLDLDVEIITCPIVREKDGLALSSRNVYLTGEDRCAARVLSRSLWRAEELVENGERDTEKIVEEVRKVFAAEPRTALDYAKIADLETLEPVSLLRSNVVALVAAYIGSTRLIDNTILHVS